MNDLSPRPTDGASRAGAYVVVRLLASLALMTVGTVGMYVGIVGLKPIAAEFGISRGVGSLPYALFMIGYAFGNVIHGRLADRYGDYGLIGVTVTVPRAPAEWEIDSFLMSCRALGRGAEGALLAHIEDAARAALLAVSRASSVWASVSLVHAGNQPRAFSAVISPTGQRQMSIGPSIDHASIHPSDARNTFVMSIVSARTMGLMAS